MNATEYILNKAYTRSVKNLMSAFVISSLAVAMVAFMSGRTYEYVQTVDSTAHEIAI